MVHNHSSSSARRRSKLEPEVPVTTQLTYASYPVPGYQYSYTQPQPVVYSPPPFYSYVVAVPPSHLGVSGATTHLHPSQPAPTPQYPYSTEERRVGKKCDS